MSLRSRLIAGIALVTLVLFAAAVLNTRSTRNQLIGQIDERLLLLSRSNDRFDGFDRGAIADPALAVPPPPLEPFERLSDLYEGYVDGDGALQTIFAPNLPGDDRFGTPTITAADVPEIGTRLRTSAAAGGDVTYRVLIEATDGTHAHVWAIPIDDVEDTIERLVLVQVLGSAAILAALGLVGWWVVHLGIRPVKEMTQTATRIAAGDLTVRVPEANPATESGQLAVALNQMLGTIEEALDERAGSERRLRRFVADASHELRTPLTTIRGYAELYRIGGLASPDSLADAMRRTEQEAARMGRLVEDMLTLAKLDEQRPMEARPVDLVRLARDAAADARVRAPGRPIHFDATIDSATVSGDEDRLRQVIGNLVGNALVHTDEVVPVTIRIGRGEGDRVIVLEVSDGGPGMPPDVASRVKERFFRADPARSRNRGGSGLGLAIADAAVVAHGGTVEIDSAEGHGTTVRLTLPTSTSGG